MEDKNDFLKESAPFGYREIKDSKIQVTFNGRLIKTLVGREVSKLQRVLDLDDDFKIQLFLAKITGQFKFGNEKVSKNRG